MEEKRKRIFAFMECNKKIPNGFQTEEEGKKWEEESKLLQSKLWNQKFLHISS